MASDLFVFEPEIISSDTTTDFSLFCNNDSFSSLDILHTINNQPNPVDQFSSFDHFASTVFSSSPPSNQFENLSLCHTTQFQSQPDSSFLANGYEDFTDFNDLQVKTEQNVDSSGYDLPHSYSGIENLAKYMQRSFSSNSFDGKPAFGLSDLAVETSNNLHNLSSSSPRIQNLTGHMRRVCSTGDLQSVGRNYSTQRSYSSPLATESSSMVHDLNFKVGRYSAEQRKERISKYRAKRTQRNFNKTIKYACRKTLADTRPRIRGRFARNDEIAEIPKTAFSSSREEEEDDFWFGDGLHEEEEEAFVSSFAKRQFQFHGGF